MTGYGGEHKSVIFQPIAIYAVMQAYIATKRLTENLLVPGVGGVEPLEFVDFVELLRNVSRFDDELVLLKVSRGPLKRKKERKKKK